MKKESNDNIIMNRQQRVELNLTRSQENLLRARKSLALGVSSGMRAAALPRPLYIERGFGPRFIDVDGNEFIDQCLAWGPLILGHAHPAINEAIIRQLDRGYTFGAQCELEIEVAEKIREIIPCAERVLYSNTGTEAVQVALRIARSATGRAKVIKFEGHYHGWSDNVLVSYTPELQNAGPHDRPQVVPASAGQLPATYKDTVVLPWNDERQIAEYLAEEGRNVAAIITEPILCNNGCILPEPGYLELLRKLADRHGAALIFDEVITGFRAHLGGAQALYDVTPDLAIFGKAIAGGFPFSVIAGKEALIAEVDAGRTVHAGTFNGNPIGLSAALTTMTTLAMDDGAALKQAQTYGENVIATLRDLAKEHDLPMEVSGLGAVFRPILGARSPVRNYRDYAKADKEAGQVLSLELFKRGVYCVPDGRWYVSAVHGAKELHHLQTVLPEAVEALARQYHEKTESL